jgi:hypothetical protein
VQADLAIFLKTQCVESMCGIITEILHIKLTYGISACESNTLNK